MPFPLFNLPYVAQREVIKCMHVYDIWNLLQTSRNAQKRIQTYSKNISITIDIYYGKGEHLEIESSGESWLLFVSGPDLTEIIKKFDEMNNKSTKLINAENGTTIQTAIDFFVKFFNLAAVTFYACEAEEEQIHLLEHIVLHHRIPLNTVDWVNKDMDEEMVKKVLIMFSNAHVLTFRNEIPRGFTIDSFNRFAMSILILHSAPHLTSDHLIALMNCTEVYVYKTNLTSTDLNQFLKETVAGRGTFKYFGIYSSSPSFDITTILDGIEGIIRDETEIYFYRNGDKFIIDKSSLTAFVVRGPNYVAIED